MSGLYRPLETALLGVEKIIEALLDPRKNESRAA